MGSCSVCNGHNGCPCCDTLEENCRECEIGIMVEESHGVFVCDNCGNTDIFYDEDYEYELRAGK